MLYDVFPAFVYDFELVRRVGVEERLHDFFSLVLAAAVVGVAENGHFEIVREPGRKAFGVSLLDIFPDRDEDIGIGPLHDRRDVLRFCGKKAR